MWSFKVCLLFSLQRNDGHYGCSTKNHGVNLDFATDTYNTLGSLPNRFVVNQVTLINRFWAHLSSCKMDPYICPFFYLTKSLEEIHISGWNHSTLVVVHFCVRFFSNEQCSVENWPTHPPPQTNIIGGKYVHPMGSFVDSILIKL